LLGLHGFNEIVDSVPMREPVSVKTVIHREDTKSAKIGD
jgi:hypothetical protein